MPQIQSLQPKSRLRSISGVTLLEVLVATAILTFSIGGAMKVFQRMTRDIRVARNFASADQVEQLLQSTVFRRTQDYLYRVSDPAIACKNNSLPTGERFQDRWNVATPQGVKLDYVSSTVLTQLNAAIPAVAHFTASAARAALNGPTASPRCNRDTLNRTSGDFGTQNNFYFCLRLATGGGGSLPLDDVRNAQPVFGEFLFTTRRAETNALLTCNDLATWFTYGYPRPTPQPPSSKQGQLVANMSYTLYWASSDPDAKKVFRQRSGSSSQTWLW